MNTTNEISFIDGISSFNFSACNDTEEEEEFEMSTVVDVITLLLSLPINSYVIWLIVKGIGNGLAAEFFILNYCICEIFLCFECLASIISYQSDIFRGIENFLDGLAITGRPLFECLICLERYLAVVHPVHFLKYKPLRYRLMCSAVAWVIGFAFSIFNFMVLFFFFNKLYFISWVGQFFIFLSIEMFCCVAVLRALKQSGPGERGREREDENNMKRRAFDLIRITTVTTVLIYAPYITTSILEKSFDKLSDIFDFISNVCFLLAGLVQPILFLYRVGKLNFIKCQ